MLIRADASTAIGTGHLMRCLALAQAQQEQGGPVICASVAMPAGLAQRWQAAGISPLPLRVTPGSAADATATVALARSLGVGWVVVDGYHFGADYQHALQQAGLRVLFLDDYGHGAPYQADLVLNQNLHAQAALYTQRSPWTRLLLGTEYTLLRREFWRWRGQERQVPPQAQKILLTLGGSDPNNVTLRVIQALQGLEGDSWEAIAVVGSSNPHTPVLAQACATSGCPIQLRQNVTEMPELMAWADLAIAGAGSTAWELAFMGVPSLLLIAAANQVAIATSLDAQGLAVNLGWAAQTPPAAIAAAVTQLLNDSPRRLQMAKAGPKLVDGWGVTRVLAALTQPDLLQFNPLNRS